MRVLLAVLLLGCLALGVAGFESHVSSELTPIFSKDIAFTTAADGVSLVESEAEAGARWEFPSPAFCSGVEDKETGPWAMANRLYQAAHSGQVSDRTDVITEAAAVPLVPCPSVTHTGAAPTFKACCATHKHERFAANDFVDMTYGCKDVPSTPELVAKYEEWRAHADKGELPVSKFLKLQCPQNPSSRQFVRKVCESELDCPDSGSDKGKCCWSLFSKAPGLCFTKKCPHLTSEIKGRCDSDSDCHRLRIPGGRLVCCNNGGMFKSSTRRRGFCVPPTECKSSEVSFDCGHENKCTIGARFRFNKHKADKAKCCQSLKPSMSLRPDRQCLQSCDASQVDVTDKPVSALIPTLPLLAAKEGDTPEARAYNMMRFAQIASKVFEMNGDTDTFLAVQKKRTLREGCESSSNKLYKTGAALALHTANSLLTAISPFLLLDMARNTPVSEKFQANINNLPGVELTQGATKTPAEPHQYASILTGLTEGLGGKQGDAKKLFGALLGFAPDTTDADEIDLVAKLEKFFNLFSLNPINKLRGAAPPADVDPSWFNRLTSAFQGLSAAILKQCKVKIVDAGAFTTDVHGAKHPDYITVTSWIKNRSLFQVSIEDADPALDENEVKKRHAAFAQARVCYSLWPRLGFGTHFLKDTFKNEMQELHEKLEIVGRVATIAGSLASSVTFGGSPAAAKVIRFGLKKYEEKKKSIQAATDAALDDLVAETIKDIPKDYNSACANFVNRGKLFSYPYNYKRLCPSSTGDKGSDSEFSKLPAHLQIMVKALCTKAGAIRKKKHAKIEEYKKLTFQKKDHEASAARAMISEAQDEQDKYLKQVTELYGGCSWTNDLDAQIGAMQSFFNYSLSLISCNRDKIDSDKVDEEARAYFESQIVAVTPDQELVWQMYEKMMEPSIAIKIAGSVLDIFELAEPVMSSMASNTFGQLTAIAEAKTHILQEMKRAGIDVKVTMPAAATTTTSAAATTTPATL